MNLSSYDGSIYSRNAALKQKESLRNKVGTNKKYTLWSALEAATLPESQDQTSSDAATPAATPPFINLANGDEVSISDFRKKIGAMCLLFLDLSEDCHKNSRQIVKDFLKKMDDLEVPARTIVVPVQQSSKSATRPQITQEEYDQIVDGLPGGLVLPSANDPRAHILSSFREPDMSSQSTHAVLTTFDSAGNKLNSNAFYDMFDDLSNDLRNFPYRKVASDAASLIKLFRSEFVDPDLLECPCVCLFKLASSTATDEEEAKNVQAVSLLFSNAAKQYRAATGEQNNLKFFHTRTKDETDGTRDADKCRLGHPLARRGAFDPTQCYGCVAKAASNMGCVPCGFDLCQKCYDAKIQIPHSDVLLMSLLCDEFSRAAPERLCCIGWNYKSGVFAAIGSVKSDEELFAFFQKIERAK